MSRTLVAPPHSDTPPSTTSLNHNNTSFYQGSDSVIFDDASEVPESAKTAPPEAERKESLKPIRFKRTWTRMSKTEFECQVCGEKTQYLHMGLKVCRACSSFFRRAVAEKLVFYCNDKNTCDLKSGDDPKMSRVRCRACRFRRCEEAGVRRADAGPVSLAVNPSTGYPSLKLLVDGYSAFVEVQASIVMKLKPEGETKIAKMVHPEFMLLHEACVPSRHFPFMDSKCVMTIVSHFLNLDSYEYSWLFDDLIDDSRLEKFFRDAVAYEKIYFFGESDTLLFSSLVKDVPIFMAKFLEYVLGRTDAVVLLLLSLYKHAEYFGFLTDEMERFKEDILRQWANGQKNGDGDEKSVSTHISGAMFVYGLLDHNVGNALAHSNLRHRRCAVARLFMKKLAKTSNVKMADRRRARSLPTDYGRTQKDVRKPAEMAELLARLKAVEKRERDNDAATNQLRRRVKAVYTDIHRVMDDMVQLSCEMQQDSRRVAALEEKSMGTFGELYMLKGMLMRFLGEA